MAFAQITEEGTGDVYIINFAGILRTDQGGGATIGLLEAASSVGV